VYQGFSASFSDFNPLQIQLNFVRLVAQTLALQQLKAAQVAMQNVV